MYGWRARVGVLLPTNNTVLEPELAFFAPEGVTFHATRMVSSRTGHGSVEGLQNLVTNVDRAAEELSIAGVNAIIYGCLSTSFVVSEWEEELPRKVARWTGVPAVTAFAATCSALQSFAARRVAVLCPYGTRLQEAAVPAFARAGLTVTVLHSLNVTGLQAVCNVPPQDVYRAARALDRTGADALCILATDLPALPVVAALEQDLGLPVVATNQALLWAALALAGVKVPVAGAGNLFTREFKNMF